MACCSLLSGFCLPRLTETRLRCYHVPVIPAYDCSLPPSNPRIRGGSSYQTLPCLHPPFPITNSQLHDYTSLESTSSILPYTDLASSRLNRCLIYWLCAAFSYPSVRDSLKSKSLTADREEHNATGRQPREVALARGLSKLQVGDWSAQLGRIVEDR